ncbi:MAG: HDOD domain-containing protein [Helicobacteraceae bacterium]|jgi:HD-like signal output (HDOD) protein|nr:HDOD domain-containing protein [Helicobacteraceae bacterium]
MNDAIVKSVKNLPPLPKTAIKVQEVCANPLGSVAELTKVIEEDPMLTANLLKAANSPLYGFAREIKTLSQAVSLFGMATVRGFAIASVVRNSLAPDLSPYDINADQFVQLCQLQNALTIRWYGIFDRSKLEELSPASFLSPIGRLIMANELVKSNKVEPFKELWRRVGLEKAEAEILQSSYQEVSAAIFAHWHFEPALVEIIRHSEDPSRAAPEIIERARVLRVAQIAADFPNGVSEKSAADAVNIAKDYGMSAQALENVIKTLTNRNNADARS